VVKLFGISVDIHDRKLAQQAVAESENRFRTMAEQSPMWIWMTDETVNVTYANKLMLTYLGLSHYNEFSGHVWERLTHPDDIQSVYAAFGEASQKQHLHLKAG
jgi:PAS domain S-box-containing protein